MTVAIVLTPLPCLFPLALNSPFRQCPVLYMERASCRRDILASLRPPTRLQHSFPPPRTGPLKRPPSLFGRSHFADCQLSLGLHALSSSVRRVCQAVLGLGTRLLAAKADAPAESPRTRQKRAAPIGQAGARSFPYMAASGPVSQREAGRCGAEVCCTAAVRCVV